MRILIAIQLAMALVQRASALPGLGQSLRVLWAEFVRSAEDGTFTTVEARTLASRCRAIAESPTLSPVLRLVRRLIGLE